MITPDDPGFSRVLMETLDFNRLADQVERMKGNGPFVHFDSLNNLLELAYIPAGLFKKDIFNVLYDVGVDMQLFYNHRNKSYLWTSAVVSPDDDCWVDFNRTARRQSEMVADFLEEMPDESRHLWRFK